MFQVNDVNPSWRCISAMFWTGRRCDGETLPARWVKDSRARVCRARRCCCLSGGRAEGAGLPRHTAPYHYFYFSFPFIDITLPCILTLHFILQRYFLSDFKHICARICYLFFLFNSSSFSPRCVIECWRVNVDSVPWWWILIFFNDLIFFNSWVSCRSKSPLYCCCLSQ